MTRSANKLIPADFPTLPGLDAIRRITIISGVAPDDVEAVGYLVHTDGEVPPGLGFDRDALTRAGLTFEVGQTVVIPGSTGPDRVAIGAGLSSELDPTRLRDIAAAFARAAPRRSRIALHVGAITVPTESAVRALVEGAVLARYRYTPLKRESAHTALDVLSLEIDGIDVGAFDRGVFAAQASARAAVIARDLANTPPGHLTATDLGGIATALGAEFGFAVDVFDKEGLIALGCGGLLGVNRGSAEEPRMIKLTYTPTGASTGHVGLVGKGIMYDSGGISLKPSDPMHLLMKMDMGGAAAVLGSFTGLRDRGATAQVTGWLMCTDNMPSGDAYKLGDVLVARGGTTVEVKNTDAEGRLVMMDALVLANEDRVDAIIDVATLTGAALMALGASRAPVFANAQWVADLVLASASATDEPLWQFPLERKYRPQLDSDIADIANLGGPYAGATTAALFLAHFVGDTPWAHLDIAGTMQTDKDDSWRSVGATGFGARTLLEVASFFAKPIAGA